jgi:iron complex outermembrane receptor protein
MRNINGPLAGMLAALITAPALWAQAPAAAKVAAADAGTLEEVVVTAEKREVNLQKTAISIQVTSGEELRKNGKKRIEEIMDGVVGVQAQGAEVGASFYMRGIGSDRGQAGGFGTAPTQNAVAILVDGVYQGAREAINTGTLDLAQAEVMRGPQSTTLGGSSLAGALSLVSNKPVFSYQGSGQLEVGSYDKLGLEGVFNAPISDNQALRIAASTEKRNAYISSGLGNSDLFNARLKYRWLVNDNLDIVLTASRNKVGGAPVTLGGLSYQGYHTAYSNCTINGGTQNCDGFYRGFPITYAHVNSSTTYLQRSNPWDDGMPAGAWGHEPLDHYANNSFSANVDWKLGIGTLSIVPSIQTGSLLTAEAGTNDFYLIEDNSYKTRQIDVNLSSNAGSRFTWLVGYNYYYTNTTGFDHFVISPGSRGPGFGFGPSAPCPVGSLNCFDWIGIGESSQKTNGLYGNATFPVTDAFRVIAGLRYTKDVKGAQGTIGDATLGTFDKPGPIVFGPTGSRDWSKTTYRAGVEYDIRPQSMAYATFSTGYQPGNLQWDGMGGVFNVVSPNGQTLDQITVGVKNRLFDNKLQFNVELYDSTYHDRGQAGAITAGNATAPACVAALAGGMGALVAAPDYSCVAVGGLSVPKLKSRGADVELNWLPTAADRLDFNVEYLDAKQSAPVASTPITALAIEQAVIGCGGMGPPCSPTLTASAGANALLALYDARVGVYEGATLQSSPKLSGNFSYRHDFTLPSGSRLSPTFNLAYKSSYWTSFSLPAPLSPQSPGPAGQDAYSIYNFNLNWASSDGKLNITGYVKNIGNKPVLLNFEGGGFRGASDVSLGDPRTYGLIMAVTY